MNGYRPRTVTQYGVETINGWPTKFYGLAVEGGPVRSWSTPLDPPRVRAFQLPPASRQPLS